MDAGPAAVCFHFGNCRDLLLEHHELKMEPFLYTDLESLAYLFLFFNRANFAMWDARAADAHVFQHSGQLLVTDWAYGFSNDCGSLAVLPQDLHACPADREAYRTRGLGQSKWQGT